MAGHRRRVRAERPFSVVMLLIGAYVGGSRWFLPIEVTGWEIALRVFCVLFALVCFVGAVDLWFMGRRR